MFEEARTSGSLDIEEGGTGVLRMVEIISCKIFSLRFYWSWCSDVYVQLSFAVGRSRPWSLCSLQAPRTTDWRRFPGELLYSLN